MCDSEACKLNIPLLHSHVLMLMHTTLWLFTVNWAEGAFSTVQIVGGVLINVTPENSYAVMQGYFWTS